MDHNQIVCPHCKQEFALSDTLEEQLRAEVSAQVALARDQMQQEAAGLAAAEAAKAKAEAEALALQVKAEAEAQAAKTKIEAEAQAAKAKADAEAQLQKQAADLHALQNQLQTQQEKLSQAQAAQTAALVKERELDDAKRELDLTIAKKVQSNLDEVRQKAKREAEEGMRLYVLEKDQTIGSMKATIEELKRKSEQGSQQLQGEVQELELENQLRQRFIHDQIDAVAKGEFGGDVLQRVYSANAQLAGSMLWEAKRTKNWSEAWLVKLREDQRNAKADVAILVSHALPKEVETFAFIDGIWVCSTACAMPVATMLRLGLLQVNHARTLSLGQQSKAEMVYQYLTGAHFRQRIEAIVEAFTSMQEDLASEKKALQRQWAKREAQIERVMNSTVGMYGDLQGIAGKSLQEIKGLGLDTLGLDG